jgi:YfiH family protein
MIAPEQVEVVGDFTSFGIHAFTTTRATGSFSSGSDEPVRVVMARWDALRATAAAQGVHRLATAAQVHGARVLVHAPGWEGWLRGPAADGHVATTRGTALAVTIADCVPIFLAHPSGAVAALHSGWRGTAARIVEQGIAALTHRGYPATELRMHLGPAICGRCYQVSADVVRQLTGESVPEARPVDLRAMIADHARALGVHAISISSTCTRCDNDRFYSHRAGDSGRQVAVIYAA